MIAFTGACVSTGTPSTGTPVLLGEDNLSRLTGKWSGRAESWGVGGSSPSSNAVSLRIQDKGIAKFSLGTGEDWDTIVQFKDGKAVMGYGYGYREFILKESNGRLTLEASYEAFWQGQPRNYRIVLTKRGG